MKTRAKLHMRLPAYASPRNQWRRLIESAVRKRQMEKGISYPATSRLDLVIRLYLRPSWLDM